MPTFAPTTGEHGFVGVQNSPSQGTRTSDSSPAIVFPPLQTPVKHTSAVRTPKIVHRCPRGRWVVVAPGTHVVGRWDSFVPLTPLSPSPLGRDQKRLKTTQRAQDWGCQCRRSAGSLPAVGQQMRGGAGLTGKKKHALVPTEIHPPLAVSALRKAGLHRPNSPSPSPSFPSTPLTISSKVLAHGLRQAFPLVLTVLKALLHF
jgi:hypothetical protein